jgi:hypothetical protein
MDCSALRRVDGSSVDDGVDMDLDDGSTHNSRLELLDPAVPYDECMPAGRLTLPRETR